MLKFDLLFPWKKVRTSQADLISYSCSKYALFINSNAVFSLIPPSSIVVTIFAQFDYLFHHMTPLFFSSLTVKFSLHQFIVSNRP